MTYNVPAVPGVPALLGGTSLATAPNTLASITGSISLSDISGLGAALGSQWGFFENGSAIIQADTVLSVDYREEYVISDHPVERGGFESFNKVKRPYDIRFRFAAGQTRDNRKALLDSIASVVGTMRLFTASMPEAVYQNVCLEHQDFHRTTEQGVGLLVVDVWGWQIVVANATQTYDTPQVGGAVQAQPFDASTANQATTATSNLYRGNVANIGTPNINSLYQLGGSGLTSTVDTSVVQGAVSGSGPFSNPGPIMKAGSM